ncbi:hypothetical protein Tco_0438767 [Tanacetum coccineum]
MADNRTMAQMLQAPIEGYEDAIVVPPINANNFELKQPLINLVQSNKFTGRQDPHNHLRFFNKVTSTFRHPEVPNTSIKLLLFPFSLDGEARDFRGEEIDEEYERDCEIRIRKLKQDFNEWGSKVRKKEKAYEEEKLAACCRYFAFRVNFNESDEVIKSSVENLVPIPREFEGISDDSCDMPICDIGHINVESDLLESLINRDTSIDYSSKIDPIFEEFSGELAHIAPIPPGIVEADFNQNDDTSSDDDDFEDIEYVSLDEVDQEEKEFDLDDILQIQDVILREKLLNVSRLISNIESLKDNPSPVMDSDSSITSLSFSDNSLPEFESFSDHTKETRS